jgi:hypothetical protein
LQFDKNTAINRLILINYIFMTLIILNIPIFIFSLINFKVCEFEENKFLNFHILVVYLRGKLSKSYLPIHARGFFP